MVMSGKVHLLSWPKVRHYCERPRTVARDQKSIYIARLRRYSTASLGQSLAANIAPPTLASNRMPTTLCHERLPSMAKDNSRAAAAAHQAAPTTVKAEGDWATKHPMPRHRKNPPYVARASDTPSGPCVLTPRIRQTAAGKRRPRHPSNAVTRAPQFANSIIVGRHIRHANRRLAKR